MNKSIAEVSKDTLKIEGVLSTLSHGDYISYGDLANKSGVSMDNKGKSYLRTALKRLKLDYTTIKGEGIELEGKNNQTAILAGGIIKMDRAVKRTNKQFKQAPEKPYFKDQSMQDKTFILSTGAILGAISENSKKAKVFFPKPPTKKISN